MLDSILKALSGDTAAINSKEQIAELLKTTPGALDVFEKTYKQMALGQQHEFCNFFDMNSRDMSRIVRKKTAPEDTSQCVAEISSRVVDELLYETMGIKCIDSKTSDIKALPAPEEYAPLTKEDLAAFPLEVRPQLTGTLIKADIDTPSAVVLLEEYLRWKTERDPKKREYLHFHFRQGLDILDLDPLSYAMLGTNKNSMGYWLPAISMAAKKHGFFQIPETTVVKVPLPILQLSRTEYTELNKTTLKIVDDWAMEAFHLDVSKTYFVKTGTFSSKFDFRNCKVMGEKEVRELGEYLLFISNQAAMMAGPLTRPSMIGVSTTNEWVVREYIEDKENNPCIYKGLPLHTEYRVFVDFDTDEVLGAHPYWDPDTMAKHFKKNADTDVHSRHDYTIFKAYETVLTERYKANVDTVVERMREMVSDVNLTGQWSVDIMQNSDEFWLIDMALAAQSVFNECIPAGKLKEDEDSWLPDIPELAEVLPEIWAGLNASKESAPVLP